MRDVSYAHVFLSSVMHCVLLRGFVVRIHGFGPSLFVVDHQTVVVVYIVDWLCFSFFIVPCSVSDSSKGLLTVDCLMLCCVMSWYLAIRVDGAVLESRHSG